MKKAKITHTNESVIIEKDDKRYEVYFEGHDRNYAIFVGPQGNGQFIELPFNENGSLTYWAKF